MKFTLRSQRRRSSQTGPGISLFPFLAVLICTMGALVPLLLAITRTARLQGEAAAAAKLAQRAAQRSAELRIKREDVQWRIGQLKRSREQTAAQLADARLELGHLEDHSRRLRTQLAQYEKTVGEFERLENADQQQSQPNASGTGAGPRDESVRRSRRLPKPARPRLAATARMPSCPTKARTKRIGGRFTSNAARMRSCCSPRASR